MINVSYDKQLNIIIVEFKGTIDPSQEEQFFTDIKKVLPKCCEGFQLLTDLSGVERWESRVQDTIKRAMDFLNAQGVKRILRVIPHPSKDIGFNIMSIFHYSPSVKLLTLQSRKEAIARLERESARANAEKS